LLPCPTVIAPIMLSGAMNNFENAIFYILIYVLGMALTMIVVMFLFFFLKEAVVKRFEKFSARINPHLVSAILILTVGVIYLLMRIFAHESHS
jgi:cytochrome c biogenesis protein CcdA